MEFKRGNYERRADRRICSRCSQHCGTKQKCPGCGKATKGRIRIVWFENGERQRQLTNCWREEEAAEVLQGIEADYWRQQRLGISRQVGGSVGEAIAALRKAARL